VDHTRARRERRQQEDADSGAERETRMTRHPNLLSAVDTH
jgi:hypothetical protein